MYKYFVIPFRWLTVIALIVGCTTGTGTEEPKYDGYQRINLNKQYLKYIEREEKAQTEWLMKQNEPVRSAVLLNHQITLAYLSDLQLKNRQVWESELELRLNKLFSDKKMGAEERLIASGVFLDSQVRRNLGDASSRTHIPSLRHLEECGVDLSFNRTFSRYAKALVMNDAQERGVVLLEVQNALSCMSADQVDDYAHAVGSSLVEWSKVWASGSDNFALRGAFTNPALLIFDTVKHRGPSVLHEHLVANLQELSDATTKSKRIFLYDIFSGRLIEFDGATVAGLIPELLKPRNIGTGQCGFAEMSASGTMFGNPACGRGLDSCGGDDNTSDQKTAFGVSHNELSNNCFGAGGSGNSSGGAGGGPVSGKGYGACVIDTTLGARNSGNQGWANCMFEGRHGRLKARLKGKLNPLKGVRANPECTNPLMSEPNGKTPEGTSDDNWRKQPFNKADPEETAENMLYELENIESEPNAILTEEKSNVSKAIESKWGRCVVDSMMQQAFGEYGRDKYAEACQKNTATKARNSKDYRLNTTSGLASSDTVVLGASRTGEILIDLLGHSWKDANVKKSWARSYDQAYKSRVRDTLFHEALGHQLSDCGYTHMRADHSRPGKVERTSSDQDHEYYEKALGDCKGEGDDDTLKPKETLPAGPHEPGFSGSNCSPHAEAMAEFMQCSGFLDAKSGRTGLDINGNVIKGGVLDPTYGRTYPQDPYSGSYDTGILGCFDAGLSTGAGGRVAQAMDQTSQQCTAMLCEAEQTNCACAEGGSNSLPFALARKASFFGSKLCESSNFCFDDPNDPIGPWKPDDLPSVGPGCVGLTCGVDVMIKGFHGAELEKLRNEL